MSTILIIEDESTILENILELLGLENFEALGTASGLAGIQLAQEHIPNAIICDIMLPDIDGYEVLKTLRSDPTTEHIPFLFLSARRLPSDIARGLELGANRYVTKPFTSEELLSAIHGVLNEVGE